MSIHIGAKQGQIASTVLMPGDPLRAKYFAETLLDDVSCFNEVRGMYGFTGNFGDNRVSVMGSGMGIPSISIYVHELIAKYNVKTVIRVGTCGALQPDLAIGDIVLPMAASTDSHVNRLRFGMMDFAPVASFDLLSRAYEAAVKRGATVKVGGILSTDAFYLDDPEWWQIWSAYGVLACEMETSALYTLASKYEVQALSVLTVSDSLVSGQAASSSQRERGFLQMAQIALDLL